MMLSDIAKIRLINQGLATRPFKSPAEVVYWMGAIQSQDLSASMYAIGLRMPGAAEAAIEQTIADKTLIRSWLMRGTIHLMPSEDAHWMVGLLAPRQNLRAASNYRRAELTEKELARAGEVIRDVLQGGHRLIRTELYSALNEAGIDTKARNGEQRGMHILVHWAQRGLICITPRRGKQQTFALFDEWLPTGSSLFGDDAIAELAQRYFRSHGPATLKDFAWWTGLTMTEVKRGFKKVESRFRVLMAEGNEYWIPKEQEMPLTLSRSVLLLPNYDEYTVGYTDRSVAIAKENLPSAGYGIDANIIIDGRIAGTWKRIFTKDKVTISIKPLVPLTTHDLKAIEQEAMLYASFFGVKRLEVKQA